MNIVNERDFFGAGIKTLGFRYSKLIVVLGISLLAISVGGSVLLRSSGLSVPRTPQFTADVDTGGAVGAIRLRIQPNFELPKGEISQNKAFPLSVQIRLVSASFLNHPDDLSLADGKEVFSRAVQALRLSINLAGADISPETPQRLDESNIAKWSIAVQSVGQQTGFIHVESDIPSDVVSPRDTSFDLTTTDVTPPPIRWLTMAGLPLGILATIFGLIASYLAMRDRSRTDRKKAENNKPTIIRL